VSAWWYGLWNDPMRDNPWALGLLVLILTATFGLFELIYRMQRMFRRRKQETTMTDSNPSRPDDVPAGDNWVMSADDRQAADRAAAERVIADSRAHGEIPERWATPGDKLPEVPESSYPPGATELTDVVSVQRDGEKVTVETQVGEDDGEPGKYADPNEPGEESRRLQSLMRTDPRLIADPLNAPISPADPAPITAGPFRRVDIPVDDDDYPRLTDDRGRALRDIAAGECGEFMLAGPQPGRNILAGKPVMAAAKVPAPLVRVEREPCPHCEGMGYMPSISDHLRASIALVGQSGDPIVQAFYAELLSLAPGLAGLFPRDLLDLNSPAEPLVPTGEGLTDEGKREMLIRAGLIGENDPLPPDPPRPFRTGRQQRDKLLKALIALSELYDPADDDKMNRLDTALKIYGRSHAAFIRPDGSVQGATWEEYATVKTVLFRTLAAAAGAAWKPEYTASWSQAYDYAAAVMVAEQHRSGFSEQVPRFPRQ
jgi:hemoglobin-like flavoprotein